mmetsp:Transcript_2598/g.5378  ORF Transcript_2598/g.5378 Transcript_2598/m.5378 type:complete len:84 (-) Transcript_2598:464-715(-)
MKLQSVSIVRPPPRGKAFAPIAAYFSHANRCVRNGGHMVSGGGDAARSSLYLAWLTKMSAEARGEPKPRQTAKYTVMLHLPQK